VAFSLYLDEDSGLRTLVTQLRAEGFDVVRPVDVGMEAASDEAQLEFATRAGRALLTANRADFLRIHAAWMQEGRHHAGIIIRFQRSMSVGEVLRQLRAVLTARSTDEMRDRVEFLSRA
jgi:hypothetical protein